MTRKTSVENYGTGLAEVFSERNMVVFLCGPSLKDLSVPGAQLRKNLLDTMDKHGFEVVLGEDDGLEDLRGRYGLYAHENELQFIRKHCNAIVLIASSPGSLCELGLFAYDKVHSSDNETDFILILEERFKGIKSYVIEGPATAVDDFGKVFYGDLGNFDITPIVDRLTRRRAVYFTDTRGRPSGRGLGS